MSKSIAVEGCTRPEILVNLLGRRPAVVVHVRVLALATMFPGDLREVLAAVPYDVAALVVSPDVASAVGVANATLGETLVFASARLVGRIDKNDIDPGARLVGVLRASLSPWLGRAGAAGWEDEMEDTDASDPFTVLGVPVTATFDEVHAAWRAKLAEYHPDRFARAGEKIRRVAAAESVRLNAAFRAIADRRGDKLLS